MPCKFSKKFIIGEENMHINYYTYEDEVKRVFVANFPTFQVSFDKYEGKDLTSHFHVDEYYTTRVEEVQNLTNTLRCAHEFMQMRPSPTWGEEMSQLWAAFVDWYKGLDE